MGISILSDEDLIVSSGVDLAIHSQIKQLELFDNDTKISVKDGRFFATLASFQNGLCIRSKQALDFFLQYCDGIIWPDDVSLFNIEVYVDVDFKKFPKITRYNSPGSYKTSCVDIFVKDTKEVKLHNISDDVFGLSDDHRGELLINGGSRFTKIDLYGLRWWKQLVRFANATLCNIDEKSFASFTEIKAAGNCLPGPNVPNKLKEDILRNVIHSVPKTSTIEYRDKVVKLGGDASWYCDIPVMFKKHLGITKIQAMADGTWIDIDDVNAELCNGFDLVEIRAFDRIVFNNKKHNNSNKQYSISGHRWTELKSFEGVCDTSKDDIVTIPKDARNYSYLQICSPIQPNDWSKIKCNCMSLILSTLHFEIHDIQKLLGDNWEVNNSDINAVIPLKNFPNLQYIIWAGTSGYKGIYKSGDKWKLF
jgi:hypothetical protein